MKLKQIPAEIYSRVSGYFRPVGQWDAIKGYKDSGQGYLFYDAKKSEIKFRAVK